MNRDAEIAKKAAESAEIALKQAREMAKVCDPKQKALAREMARAAKRRHSKANRRASRLICRDYER